MSIQSFTQQNVTTSPIALSQGLSIPKGDERSQSIKDSGIVSGIKSGPDARKVLELVEDYEGNTAERLTVARSDILETSGFEDRTVSLINEYMGPDENQEDRLTELQGRVDKVRSENLKESGVAAKFPIAATDPILGLINDYAGVDGVGLEQYSLSFADAISMVMSESNSLFNSSSLGDEAAKKIFERFKEKILGNPAARTTSFGERDINADLKAFLSAAIIESLMEIVVEMMPPSVRERELSEVHEKTPVGIKMAKLQAYIERMPVLFSYQQCMLKEDRTHVSGWLKEVAAFQKKCAPLLPPIAFKEGDSQGISYAIKKDGTLRGYLQGTMHYVCSPFVPGGKEVAQVSKEVQERLFASAYIGTEVTMSPISSSTQAAFKAKGLEEMFISSIDEMLVQYAYERAIPNIGIDEEDRGGLFTGEKTSPSNSDKQQPRLQVLDLLHSSELQESLSAMRSGDIDKMKVQAEQGPHSSKGIEVNTIRNQRMAENIDLLLKTSPLQKGFFAIGANHLIATQAEPESVVELLAKKGWTVELIPPTKS